VLWIDRPLSPEGRGLWAKLEGFNPGGGMKDRAALHMVECARERGDLPPCGMIVESTSGTLGLGLVLADIMYGHPVTASPRCSPTARNATSTPCSTTTTATDIGC
jgi:S-sulfo-L-cysteine synthase (3-phospho-L-serine-dependent)